MKYKYLSVLVICLTLAAIGMMVSLNIKNTTKQDNPIAINQSDENKQQQDKSQINQNDIKKSDVKDNNVKNEQQNTEKTEINGSDIGKSNTETNKDNYTNNNTKSNSASAIENNNNVQDEAYPANAAIFKVDVGKLQDEVTLLDKAKLMTVATKISSVDYAKINNYMGDSNRTRGIINIFKLLKIRLSAKDYDQFKNVASKYVDVNCIESYIN